VCVCVLLSCVLLCSAQPTHLNIVACDPRHAHSVVPGPLNGLNSVVPGPCMSGHTVLAQRERERSRERESERERERGSTRNSWLLRATGREASRESVSGSVKSQCLASRVSVCHDACLGQCLAASNAYMPPLGTCPGGLLFSFCRELARSCLRQAHGVYVLRALLLLKPGLARVPSQVHAFNKQVLGLPCPTSRRGGKPVHNADLTARI